MSQIELARVKAKIRALAAKTTSNGATEAEAMSAMTKVGELLELYNLSLSDTFLEDENCTLVSVPYPTKRKPTWAFVFMAIGDFTDTRCWNSKRDSAIKYFGMETDCMMAEYLTKTVMAAVASELKQFQKTDTYKGSSRKRRETTAFQHGLAYRLNERLAKPSRKAPTTGTDIVVLKAAKVDEELAKIGVKIKTTYSTATYNSNSQSFSAGRAAADRVNLNRPVSSAGPSMRLLTA